MKWYTLKQQKPKEGQLCFIICRRQFQDFYYDLLQLKKHKAAFKNPFNVKNFEVVYWTPADVPKDVFWSYWGTL